MSITIRKLKHRPWPVTIKRQICDEDGTVSEVENTFVAHWKPFTEDDLQGIFDAAEQAVPAPKSPGSDQADVANLKLREVLARNALIFPQLIVGWGPEVLDEDGQPLTYSTEELAALITGPDGMAISAGLNTAMSEIRWGVAPAKNSSTSPTAGPAPSVVGVDLASQN